MARKNVFISYPDSQADRASMLYARLKEQEKLDITMREPAEKNSFGGTIASADYFIPLLSKDGLQDDLFMEDIKHSLKARKNDSFVKKKNYIIPLMTEPCNLFDFGLEDIPWLQFFNADMAEIAKVVENINGTIFLSAFIHHPVTRGIASGVLTKMLWPVLVEIGKFMSKERVSPEYNVIAFSRHLPGPGEPFEFLDPFSDDPLESSIKDYAFSEDESGNPRFPGYLAFFFDSGGSLIGETKAPQDLQSDEFEIIDDVPSGTRMILVSLGKEETLKIVSEKLKTNRPLAESDGSPMWLFYG